MNLKECPVLGCGRKFVTSEKTVEHIKRRHEGIEINREEINKN
jgi:hypothetical protein